VRCRTLQLRKIFKAGNYLEDVVLLFESPFFDGQYFAAPRRMQQGGLALRA
jgi:hypothetical protein